MGSQDDGAGPRVVIAEADPWSRELLAELVRSVRGDARLQLCADGQAALTACRPRLPALVLADRALPGLDGLDLLRELRKARRQPPLPFILLSERTDAASVREALPLAPTAYLAKPLNLEALRKRLGDLLLAPGQAPIPAPARLPASATLDDYLQRQRSLSAGAPLLDEVHSALGRRLNAAELDLVALQEEFARDPQITARLIAAANSAAQHLGRACQTLAQAFARLGVAHSLNLVLGLALQRSAALQDARLAERAGHFWQLSQRTAELAARLARNRQGDVERCYSAGLLHCLGDLALLRCLQDWQLAGGALDDQQVAAALGDHAASFGGALKSRWRLPLELRELIGAAWRLGGGVYSREALILNLAAGLARLPAGQPLDPLAQGKAAQMLRLDAGTLQHLLVQLDD
ncbi:phosphate regulon transcriptional regulatory protein PhoB [compost metagenome]